MEHLFTLTLKTVAHQCLDLLFIEVCHPTSRARILVIFNRLLSLYQLFRLFLFLEILSKVCKVLGALLHHKRLANVSIIAVTFEFSIRESQILQQSQDIKFGIMFALQIVNYYFITYFVHLIVVVELLNYPVLFSQPIICIKLLILVFFCNQLELLYFHILYLFIVANIALQLL